jgi:hypothetical protein
VSDAKAETRAAGSADPTDGVFGAGLAVISIVKSTQGATTTATTTYSDRSTYVRTEVTNADGSVTVTQIFRDGTTVTTVLDSTGAGVSGIAQGEREDAGQGGTGRQSWREITD